MKKRAILITVDIVVLAAALLFCGIKIISSQQKPINPANVQIIENNDSLTAQAHPDFIVETVIPPVPEGSNVALGKKVTSNGNTVPYVPARTVDGKTNGGFYWEGKKDQYPNLITIDLKETYTLNTVRVCLSPEAVWMARSQEFSVLISDDGENFMELIPSQAYKFDPKTGNLADIQFEPETAGRFVQLSFTSNSGGNAAQAAEIEIYSR